MPESYQSIYRGFFDRNRPINADSVALVEQHLRTDLQTFISLFHDATNYDELDGDSVTFSLFRRVNDELRGSITFPILGRIDETTPLSLFQYIENPSPERQRGLKSSYSFWYERLDEPEVGIQRGVRQEISFDEIPAEYSSNLLSVNRVSLIREVTDEYGSVERGRISFANDTSLKYLHDLQAITEPIHLEIWPGSTTDRPIFALTADIGEGQRPVQLKILNQDEILQLGTQLKISGNIEPRLNVTSLNVFIGGASVGLTFSRTPDARLIKSLFSTRNRPLTDSNFSFIRL